MLTFIFTFILFSPVYIIFFLQYNYPEDAIMWGKRWMYNEAPDISDEAIKYTKISALIGIGVLTLMFLIWFIKVL
ncbi:hypothetical protein [Sporosarcina sp. Marseille-Q4943]|uniref:hypothetical protein n=1 Tax=Sporosarcina sp. Marseille-Q4943 TaxID=2942204 RepID=UPI00208DBCD7|nr:hypothetical protein [Sporosarcina sp. Marseille-Q4943]